jgi:hypothetical protein
LNGRNITAIDLAQLNNSVIERVHIVCGTAGTKAGRGVRVAAPLDNGSYTNDISNVNVFYADRGFVAEDAGNENTFFNCEAIACNIGFDVENGVDTIGLVRGRAEGCGIGLRTAGRETQGFGVRFEANTTADVQFLAGMTDAVFLGCHTASSPTVFSGLDVVNGLLSRGGSFPQYDIQPNVSNPLIAAGRKIFAKASAAAVGSVDDLAALVPSIDSALHIVDLMTLANNNGKIEALNVTGDNTVLIAYVDNANRTHLSSYDRKAGVYNRLYLNDRYSINGANIELDGVPLAFNAHGNAFPGAPANNDRFFRDDLDIEFVYQGTRWVSSQLHELSVQISNAAATSNVLAYAPIPYQGVHGIFLERFDGTMFRTGAGEWDLRLQSITGPNVATTIATLDGNGTTANNWTSHGVEIDAVLDVNARVLEFGLIEVSGTVGCYGTATLSYRLIGV